MKIVECKQNEILNIYGNVERIGGEKKNGCWSDVITNGWTVTQIVRNSWKTGEEILTSVQWEQKIRTWKKTWKSLNVAPPSEKGILRKKKKKIKG